MTRILNLFLFLLVVASFSCSSANRLTSEQQEVANTLQAMFDAMEQKDVEGMKAVMIEDGQFHVISDGSLRRGTFIEFLEQLPLVDEKYTERFWDPTILIDGEIATLWSRYDFQINDSIVHCGVEVFNFVKLKGSWKIAGSVYTIQKENCPPNPFEN